jgi:uncharacterized membrane protein
MDVVSAKVLGTGAIVFGVVFIVTSVLRLTRPDLDLVLAILNITFGVLLLCVGVGLWRSALRRTKRDR